MKYINIENGTWIIYDEATKRVVDTMSIHDIESELEDIDSRLLDIPSEPSAQEFEEWGRQHMPRMNYETEKDALNKRKPYLQDIYNNILCQS